jgi:DNA-binding response OmpR family regulator
MRWIVRILVIEDDDRIRSFISRGLRQEGHIVDATPSGAEGLSFWSHTPYDLVILDISLPDGDGFSLLKTLRKQGSVTPVIIVSAHKTVEERITGLDSGADDYLTKPFSFAELMARIRALMRRSAKYGETARNEDTEISLAGMTVNRDTRQVTREGVPICLPPKEFALLFFLMQNAGRVLTKETILSQLWDYRFTPQSNIVDALICRLRNKIDTPFGTALIQTRKGIGYVFAGQD